MSPQASERVRELGVNSPTLPTLSPARARELNVGSDPAAHSRAAMQDMAGKIALTSLWDIGLFFAVLMVGFAYVWKRGDLDWVRSTRSHAGEVVERAPVTLEVEQRGARPAGSILTA